MKSSYLLMIVILTVVFCNSPTLFSTDEFKTKILDYPDECTWYFSLYTDSTEKYAVLTDSVNSEYEIVTASSSSSRTMTYKFTNDSALMDYGGYSNTWVDRCGPYIINGSDTLPGDSVICAHYIIGTPPPCVVHKKGTWDCNGETLYFHCTGVSFCTTDYSVVDTTEQFSYYFSTNGDTLYIGNGGGFSGFVKK